MTDDYRLFDPGPEEIPVNVSAGRKRTARQHAALAAGTHPLMGGELRTSGETCGNCANLIGQGGVAGSYFKCRLRNTGGPATDVRKSWPGCTHHRFEPDGI